MILNWINFIIKNFRRILVLAHYLSTTLSLIQWRWGVTGQSSSDWLKMTSPRTPKPNYGDLSRFWTMKIAGKWSYEVVLPDFCQYVFILSKISILKFLSHNGSEKKVYLNTPTLLYIKIRKLLIIKVSLRIFSKFTMQMYFDLDHFVEKELRVERVVKESLMQNLSFFKYLFGRHKVCLWPKYSVLCTIHTKRYY